MCLCQIYNHEDVFVYLVMQLCSKGLTALLKILSTAAIASKISPPHSASMKSFPRCHQGGMALPRVGTTVGPRSPKRPRGHQVLTRDLCPGMLSVLFADGIQAPCRSRDGPCRSIQTPGALRLLVHPLVLLCPGAAVGLCAPRSPCPGTGCPPTCTPKCGSALARNIPCPAQPGPCHKPCHEGTAKGSPCPSQARNRSPGAALGMRPPPQPLHPDAPGTRRSRCPALTSSVVSGMQMRYSLTSMVTRAG